MRQLLFLAAIIFCALLPGRARGESVQILINHLGYDASGPKRAVIQGHASDTVTTCTVRDAATGEEVARVAAKEVGPVDKWRDWHYWTADFDAVTTGTYVLECEANGKTQISFPFNVQSWLLERETIGSVVWYFKGQRASGLLDKADRNVPFEGHPDRRIDAHGGWYDASGDYGKHLSHLSSSHFFNPQQLPFTAWSLFKTHEILTERNSKHFNQLRRHILGEAFHGADYLVRVKAPGGSFYRSVGAPGPGKLPEDRRLSREGHFAILSELNQKKKSTEAKPEEAFNPLHYQVSYRSGGGLAIAALARASTQTVCGDFSNADYLKAAEDAFEFLEANNLKMTSNGEENIVDDYCALMAATELYRATRKPKYREAADRRYIKLRNRLITRDGYANFFVADDSARPFFHAADAGLPVVAMLEYAQLSDISPTTVGMEARQAAWEAMRHELAMVREVPNPFGLARQYVQTKTGERGSRFFYPHDTESAPWWQGENARLGSLATAARLLKHELLKQPKPDKTSADQLEAFASDQLNWILGLNPFDVSMLHGSGRNNADYMFFDSWQYKNAPGGIINGITAGYKDEVHGIDFDLQVNETDGKDFTWRWTEQWLPHASWFLLAVALGN